jgi:hypothetical protein
MGQGDAPPSLAYLLKLCLCTMEVCLRRERCREGSAQVSAREGLILGEVSYGATREIDEGEFGSSCVISCPFAGECLKCVDIRNDISFGNIQVYTKQLARPLNYV